MKLIVLMSEDMDSKEAVAIHSSWINAAKQRQELIKQLDEDSKTAYFFEEIPYFDDNAITFD